MMSYTWIRKTGFTIAAVFLLCFFAPVYGQKQFTGWLASFNTFKLSDKKSIHADVQLRSSDEFAHTQTLLLRTGLNFHLSKQLIVTGGYAYIHNRRTLNQVTGYVDEHRIWEQLLFNHRINSLFLSHRFRLEQRLLPEVSVVNSELETDGVVLSNRFRYFLRNVLPFKKQTVFSRGAFAALQNEVFLNITGQNKVNGKFFDQNRLYLALGYRLNPSFDLEAGYMNQYSEGRGSAFTNNHIVQLAGYLRL